MSPHKAILDHVKAGFATDGHRHASHFDGKTDLQCLHLMFQSFRGTSATDARGLRLSWLGFQIIRDFFQPYTMEVRDEYVISSRDLIFLDRECALPYYIGTGSADDPKLVMFDANLATMLKLSGNDISKLRKMFR